MQRLGPQDSGAFILFQSLSGFQVRCNCQAAAGLRLSNSTGVSIPIGFSSSLQRFVGSGTIALSFRFNPYRVFKFVATASNSLTRLSPMGFNPYRVFKFVATTRRSSHCAPRRRGFNPYRVFKFVATVWRGIENFWGNCVSIPIGFSSSLQQLNEALVITPLTLFQSLSGFQVRCNGGSDRGAGSCPDVSIPIGFSSSLQLQHPIPVERRLCYVSIPIGFSSSLQQPGRHDHPSALERVSIPIGFSSSLQLVSSVGAEAGLAMFQSLSGFQVRCNDVSGRA